MSAGGWAQSDCGGQLASQRIKLRADPLRLRYSLLCGCCYAQDRHVCLWRGSAIAVRVVQAFYLARTGRPGPVLVDVPKDIQQQLAVPDWDAPMAIAGYMSRLPPPPEQAQVAAVVQALHEVGPVFRSLYLG